MENFIFVVQARMGSTRLKSKMLRPFYKKKCLLETVLYDLLEWIPCENLIVATSISADDKKIVKIADKMKIKSFCGSEKDVRLRIYEASMLYDKPYIVRICADNPFIQKSFALRLMEKVITNPGFDYYSYQVNNYPAIKTHYGFWVEIIKKEALKRSMLETGGAVYKEHVTNFIYENQHRYDVFWDEIGFKLEDFKNVRLTLDTEEDFIILKEIYSEYYETKNISSLKRIINKNDSFKERMIQNIELNNKG